MRPIEFLGISFFELMKIQPRGTFYSTSLSLAIAMVKLDMIDRQSKNEKDIDRHKKYLKELERISETTHKDLDMPLATAETIVSSIEPTKWNTEYGGKDNRGERIALPDGQSIKIIDLFQRLKESYTPIMLIVVEIIQPYSMEYRMSNANDTIAPAFLTGKNQND